MVLSDADKAVIEACFKEKGWRGHQLCREFPKRKWKVRTVNYLIHKIEMTGSSARITGSGRPLSARTQDNVDLVEELALSQDDSPGTHLSARKISKVTGISRTSVQKMIKHDLKLKSVKKVKTPQVKEDARERRRERCERLLNLYDREAVKLMCFEDEKNFPLQLPSNSQNDRIYTAGVKLDVAEERLYRKNNKFSLKIMVSCVISHRGISRPFFVNPADIKVDGDLYTNHLRSDLLPECNTLYPDGNFILVQDSAPSHASNLCQDYLRRELGNRFVDKLSWPPNSPDCNPLDYFFWNELSDKVYFGRREPFQSIEELKQRITSVWDQVTTKATLRRSINQFLPRLDAVVKCNGGSIKHLFG